MKNLIIILGIVILLAAGGYLAFARTSGTESVNINSKPANEATGVQKVVIGIKNNNYYPNTITVKAGQTVSISLDKSVTGCYRSFTIRQLGLQKNLATPNDALTFTPIEKGTYRFACSMGMGTGTFIVE